MDEEIRVWGASNEIIRGTASAISRDQLSHVKRATPDIKSTFILLKSLSEQV